MRDSQDDKTPREGVILSALLLLYALLTVPAAVYNPMASFDEAWYAAIARNTVETGDWMTLHYNDKPFWHKTPLGIWTIAVSFKAFGASDFSARLASLIAGGLCVSAVFYFGRRLAGAGVGLLAAAVLLTAQDFMRFSAKGQLDAALTLLVVLNLYLFWKGVERPVFHPLGGLCFGLALATKNQAGLLGPIIQVGYMIAALDSRPLKQWQWYFAGVVGLLIPVPWLAHQYAVHGDAFVNEFFFVNWSVYQQKASEAAQPVSRYLAYPVYLLEKHLVLSLCAIAALVWAGWSHLRGRNRPAVLLAVWIFAVPAVFSFGGADQYWYLIPMYPAVALLVALAISNASLWRRRPRLIFSTVCVWAIVYQISYFVPPPKQQGLWAAKQLATEVRRHSRPDESVTLLHHPGHNRKTIHMPAAHYYFDRKIDVVHHPKQAKRLTGRGLMLVRTELLKSTYRSVLGQQGAIEELARIHGTSLIRVTPESIHAAERTAERTVPVRR